MTLAADPQDNPPAETYMQNFSVSFEYPVIFTRDIFASANPLLADLAAEVLPR